jgi:hypothetical protein
MDNPEKPAPQVTQDEEKQITYISIYNLLINYHISFFFISTSVKVLRKARALTEQAKSYE